MSKRELEKYTYQEVYDKSLEYFNNDDLAAKVFVDKYSLKNGDDYFEKTPEDMHRRIASEICRIEKNKFKDPMSEEEIFEYLDKYKYIIPQGSILYGLGNKFQYVSLSNCFVTPSPLDSYSSIIQTDEYLVNISKRRGGVGIDLSNLRPEKMSVKNAAHTTSGLVTWMERYSNSIREVGQNNRRGALMLTLNVHHPQIMDFINAKDDLKKVTGANISVRLTDEFLTAVDKRTDYELRWPIKTPQIKSQTSSNEVWDQIINRAWSAAEPGVLFWDNILKNSPADCYEDFQTESTNPSLRHDTLILTDKGALPIGWLAKNYPNPLVKNADGEWKNSKVFLSGVKQQLIKIVFTHNQTIYCTKQHKWPILNTQNRLVNDYGKIIKKNTIDLTRRDKIYFPVNINAIDNKECLLSKEDGFVAGWTLGDGWKCTHKRNGEQFGFIFSEEDIKYNIGNRVLEYTNALAKKTSTLRRDHNTKSFTYCTTDKNIVSQLTKIGCDFKKLGIPKTVWSGNKDFVHGFIDGLFSSDGYVYLHPKLSQSSITLVTSHKNIAYDVRKLLSCYGIKTNIVYSKKRASFPNYISDKEYERYDINICGIFALKFSKLFTLSNINKQNKLQKIGELSLGNYKNNRDYLVVKNIEPTDLYEDVYDITVDDDSHTFITEAGLTGNCAELPLSSFDSCRLLCLNLMSYVDKPFKYNSTFNYKKFYDHSQIAQRMMDNIVDLELECIDKIINKIKSDPEPHKVKINELDMWNQIKKACGDGRRTGVGITGLGDTFAALNIKYGSNKSIRVGEKIYKTLKFGCYRSSVDMAKELGPFKVWDHKREAKNDFLCRIKDEKLDIDDITICGKILYNDMKKYGRRNIALLTIAPTGTISTQTQTTSGIEPVFMLKYTRRKKINHNDNISRVDYQDDLGDKWQEFDVLHHNFQTWMRISEKTEVNDSPYHESCAEEINWKNRIKLQGVMQKHCDHSISATINLPEDVSVDEVKNIYTTAWKEGLKGITIYRKNSRAGVLIETKTDISTEKRPKELECEVYHVTVKGKPYFVLFGILNNNPYEIFAGKSGDFIDKSINSGKIIKMARPKGYKAILSEGTEICPITIACTESEEVISRLVSMSLRNNTPIHYIVDQLSKVDGDLTSFAKCISRALKRYVKDGTKVKEKCQSCKSEQNLVYSEGCLKCLNCSWSKCN